MGNIIQYRLHQAESQVGLMRPVIYCDEKYCEDLHQVALNEELAALLIKINPERRTLKIERCFQKVLADVPENSCIRNFDVLFNPAYKIDYTLSLHDALPTCALKSLGCAGGFYLSNII